MKSFLRRLQRHITLQDLLFLAGLLISGFLILRKIRYGLGLTNDESFYLTMPWRFLQGDAYVSDEWNMSQTSSVLLLPITLLYKLLFTGTDGIVLFMRYVYVAGHALSSLFIYSRLRRYGWGAAVASLLHFLFIPYTIKAWSYNTMAVDMLSAAGALSATTQSRKGFFLTGLLFAGAVLCCPFLAVAWPLYGLAVLWCRRKKHPPMLDVPLFRPVSFLMVTLACALLAVAFLALILCRFEIHRLEGALPFIFSDADHDKLTLLEHFQDYLADIATGCYQRNYYYSASFILFTLLMLCLALDKHRMERRPVYLAAGAVLSITANAVFICLLASYHQAMLFPIVFMGLPAYILLKEKPRALFAGLCVVGLLYSLMDHLASNNHFLVIAMALSVANIGGLIFISMVIREMREETGDDPEGRRRANAAAILCVISIALVLFFRVQTNNDISFQDKAPYLCSSMLQAGPCKGIVTNEEYAAFYDDRLSDVELVRSYGVGNLCVLSEDCWPYLALGDFPMSSYSSWFPDQDLAKVSAWWNLHPDHMPDYILIPIYEGSCYAKYSLCSASISEEGNLNAFVSGGYTRVDGKAFHIFIKDAIYQAHEGSVQ